jgi:hypothetical protein
MSAGTGASASADRFPRRRRGRDASMARTIHAVSICARQQASADSSRVNEAAGRVGDGP